MEGTDTSELITEDSVDIAQDYDTTKNIIASKLEKLEQKTLHTQDKKFIPILSMTTTIAHADIPIPTWEDWSRIASIDEDKFFSKPVRDYKYNFETTWTNKSPIAIFRGTSTGRGVDIDTNMRLRLANISHKLGNTMILDAGITKWNLRPRLVPNPETGKLSLKTIDTESFDFHLVDSISPEEQSKYKYIINVEGHSAAYRLSLELSMGSVIFYVESEYSLWFTKYLEPWVHYVPVASDLSDLLEKIEWAISHDSECEKIAANSLEFYNKYLQRDGYSIICNVFDHINNISGTPLLFLINQINMHYNLL